MKHLFHIHTIFLKSISLKKSPWFRLTLNCILIFSSPRVLCKTSSSPELETPPFPFCHQNYSEIYIMLFFLATFFLLSTSHYILYYKSWAQIFLSIFEKCWEVFKRTFIEEFLKSQEILATWPFLIFKPTISFDSKLLIRALSKSILVFQVYFPNLNSVNIV